MPRLLFEKTNKAIWISHLDLMRVFQRAFQRAGLSLTHTQGFNPRPSVSIALPLSVGVESHCELLDFALTDNSLSNEQILLRLNGALIDGVNVLRVYDECAKLKDLAQLDCEIQLEYDCGIPDGTAEEINALFFREMLLLEKRGKNGTVQQDMIPLIHRFGIERADEHTLIIHARVSCQNPSLNPMQIANAIGYYLPDFAPDFSKCKRLEVYKQDGTVFR